MSYPIETIKDTGQTIYAIIHHPDGRVWHVVNAAWEAYNVGNWASYAVVLVEQGASGYYRATYPTGISKILTTEVLYVQGTLGAPSVDDAPAIGIGQSQGVDIACVRGNSDSADNLKENLKVMAQGSAVAGTLTVTQMTTDLEDTADGVYTGRILIWTSGNLIRRATYVTGYVGASNKLTFGTMTEAPAGGDTFILI